MGDDIGSDSVTDCCIRSDSDLRQHTQQCRAAPPQKSKQTQPKPMSSPYHLIFKMGKWFAQLCLAYLCLFQNDCLSEIDVTATEQEESATNQNRAGRESKMRRNCTVY